jgi:diaminopimelate epimerase
VASKLYSNGIHKSSQFYFEWRATQYSSAVEDQEVPVEMIARDFEKQVADIVME